MPRLAVSSAVTTSASLKRRCGNANRAYIVFSEIQEVLKVGYRCFEDEKVQEKWRGEETETVFVVCRNEFLEFFFYPSL